jgi:predicted amidohydrolase
MRVTSDDNRANLRTMARWVETLHGRTNLIAFPQIDVAPLDALADGKRGQARQSAVDSQLDIFAAFAAKRSVYIAAGLLDPHGPPSRRTLVLADRTGQLDVRKFMLPEAGSNGADAADEAVGVDIMAPIAGVPIGIAMGRPLAGPSLPEEAMRTGARVICLLLHLTGSASEIRRVAVHNPPAALAALQEAMRRLAVETRVHVVAVNGVSGDTDTACGMCGGIFHFDPRGRLVSERRLYDEQALEFEIF